MEGMHFWISYLDISIHKGLHNPHLLHPLFFLHQNMSLSNQLDHIIRYKLNDSIWIVFYQLKIGWVIASIELYILYQLNINWVIVSVEDQVRQGRAIDCLCEARLGTPWNPFSVTCNMTARDKAEESVSTQLIVSL